MPPKKEKLSQKAGVTTVQTYATAGVAAFVPSTHKL